MPLRQAQCRLRTAFMKPVPNLSKGLSLHPPFVSTRIESSSERQQRQKRKSQRLNKNITDATHE